ncbi:uncharacterized protein LOC105832824 isoform X2 [Monomorium pharaonis]|uniref:uncharacterized protein LOC105832824 isoform X2 n=1 Tax=Monomorium pharaonis TaxID=307658 RepID=UPI00063F350C|nr:uncharacterized protein LOC105832824 isoform X2 [Monomorium pharaonis]
MIHLGIQYFNFNRILLLVIGLWPYQQSKVTRFQFLFLSTILTAGIVFQLTPLMTSKHTSSNLVTKVLCSTSFFTLAAIKYNLFWINIGAVKDLLMQLQHVHNQLKDKNEVAIIKEYNCIGRRYTITLTMFAVIFIFSYIISQYWMNVNVLPKNTSQLCRLPIMMEYFIDQKKYFYLILLHINAIICIGLFATVAIGTTLIAYVQHICGMFRIACYRIEHAININIRNITLKNEVWMIKNVTYAVDIHRKARKFVSTKPILVVTCMALSMFQAFQVVSSTKNIEELFLLSLFIVVIFSYMFIANYLGQNLTDHNNHVFFTAYNVQWYRAPLHVQRMILFLLQKESKKLTLNFGGLFDASMECFATLVKTSVSYFTVMCSIR